MLLRILEYGQTDIHTAHHTEALLLCTTLSTHSYLIAPPLYDANLTPLPATKPWLLVRPLPKLRRLTAHLPQRSLEFDPRPVRVDLVANKSALSRGFIRALWIYSGNIARSPYSFIHSLSSTLHSFSNWQRPWIRHFQDRQCTYESNSKTLSRNHCYRGKAVSVTYSDGVSVVLVFQHAMRMRHIVICGLSSCTIFCDISL
jgi:hypothetical protein